MEIKQTAGDEQNSSQSKHVVHHHESKEETPVVLTAAPKDSCNYERRSVNRDCEWLLKERSENGFRTFSSSLCKLLGKVTVGFAMYYFTYDPWIGKLLYLEDFYVIQAYQSQIAIRSQCNCMHFLAVIWNQASIDYYTRRGALDLYSEEGWHLFRFNREELMDMAGEE
ncbi:hypothetical protein MJG53_019847 [Ovis ammon polii x Ovis aries]|uniref:Spermidine/spermine N(1)-acetyltransferase-like protein 1 n=2 Tax=Ovis TaxID=9935 RepID=A0A835ZR85_SHEEP|nr:hypothetical protein JEQ12_020149 [Ovis aries]KAI4554548.1 hypothetical protein MJG53_019847 [Ovis ammon polii x Ovis aries]